MKHLALGLLALGLIAGQASEANAVVCARGVYRAGCAGPHGAAVVHRPAAVVVRPAVVSPVVHPYAPRCYYRNGVRVCR